MHRSPVNGTVAPSTSFSLCNTRFLIACLTASRPLVRPCLCSQDQGAFIKYGGSVAEQTASLGTSQLSSAPGI